MNYPYAPRLDSRIELTGTYLPLSGVTRFTLPFIDDTINAVVLGDDFGNVAGHVLTPLGASSAGFVFVSGQFVAGPCILGRLYTMRVELSRPYRRNREGVAIITDRLQVVRVQTQHTNAGAYSVRANMPNRTDREREFTPPTGTLIEESGSLRTLLNGDTKSMRLFLENDTAFPSSIASVDYACEVGDRAGR